MKKHQNIGFLFDLDGVLIDTESQYDNIWIRINDEFPVGIPNFQKVIKGCTLNKILNDYFPDEKVKAGVTQRLHELENKMEFTYMRGAQKFLNHLHSNNYPMALVTSSDNKKMLKLTDQMPEILEYFDFVVTGDLISNSKPSPDGYLLAASKLGISPEHCVVFEDSLQGVMAGKAAGCLVVGIYGTLEQEVIKPYSDIVVGSLSEVNLDKLKTNLLDR